jgi:hypothetical protein
MQKAEGTEDLSFLFNSEASARLEEVKRLRSPSNQRFWWSSVAADAYPHLIVFCPLP